MNKVLTNHREEKRFTMQSVTTKSTKSSKQNVSPVPPLPPLNTDKGSAPSTSFTKSGPGKRSFELTGPGGPKPAKRSATQATQATNIARERLCLVCGHKAGASYHKIPQPKKFNKGFDAKALSRLDAHNAL